MIRSIEVLPAHALRRSMPWLGKLKRLPGGGMSTWFNAFHREFAPTAGDGPFEQ